MQASVAGPARAEREPWASGSHGVWLVACAYAVALWALSLVRYGLWLAHGNDLGLFEQGLWLLAHRGLLASSSYTGAPILADAASWVLIPISWVYAKGGVAALLGVQAAAFAAGYPMILSAGSAVGAPERPTRILALLYLLYPTVVGAALYDFHPDALAVPAALAMVWAVERGRPAAYAGALVGLLLVKDTMGIAAVGVGVALAIRGRWGWAVPTVAAGALATLLDVMVATPHLAHAVMYEWPLFYGYLGATPEVGLASLASHPWLLLRWLPHPRSWEYLLWLIGPFAVPLAAGGRSAWRNPWWIPWLLVVEVNLLGQIPAITSPFDEFSVITVPFLCAAVLAGLAGRPAGPLLERWLRGGRATAMALLPACAFFAVFTVQQVHSYWLNGPGQAVPALRAAVRVIPAAAPVAAQDFVLPHLADRAQEWHLQALLAGQTFPTGTYVVLDPGDRDPPDAAALGVVSSAVGGRGVARPVFTGDGVSVFELVRPLSPQATRGAG